MGNFNISNSKVEQLNDTGDNYKIMGTQGPVAVTHQDGQSIQATGNENRVSVDKPKPGFLESAFKRLKGVAIGLVRQQARVDLGTNPSPKVVRHHRRENRRHLAIFF